MEPLVLAEFHRALNAQFAEVGGVQVVGSYGAARAEHAALRETAGLLDFSFRSRLCVTGADRARFLHGQVTNDIQCLQAGEGCYAALVTAKGKMQSDLNVYCLEAELLLDFEPALTERVSQRLEKFIVADDVQVTDVAPLYGLLSVQGPKASAAMTALGLIHELPGRAFAFVKLDHAKLGEVYLMNQPRLGTAGFELFVPTPGLRNLAERLNGCVCAVGGRPVGWQAFETARIEAGVPRFGADMDETKFPQECGIEGRAVSYTKGCYIGQEVLNRIHTLGHVNKELRGLRLVDDLEKLPVKGDKLFQAGREAGHVTSAAFSQVMKGNIALAELRQEAGSVGNELILKSAAGESRARVVELPFKP